MAKNLDTQNTLIFRACDLSDSQAWESLYQQYREFVLYCLHQLNVNPQDIEDLSQSIFLKLTHKLVQYNREKGRFRNWFRTLIKNEYLNYLRKNDRRSNREQQSHDLSELASQNRESEIDKTIQKEWEDYVYKVAIQRLQKSLRGKAIEVFKLTMKGVSVEEIARQQGIKTSSVYTLRQRAQEVVTLEIADIKQNYGF